MVRGAERAVRPFVADRGAGDGTHGGRVDDTFGALDVGTVRHIGVANGDRHDGPRSVDACYAVRRAYSAAYMRRANADPWFTMRNRMSAVVIVAIVAVNVVVMMSPRGFRWGPVGPAKNISASDRPIIGVVVWVTRSMRRRGRN